MFYVMRDLTGGWELTKGENQQGEGGGGPFCQHPDCASGHCSCSRWRDSETCACMKSIKVHKYIQNKSIKSCFSCWATMN